MHTATSAKVMATKVQGLFIFHKVPTIILSGSVAVVIVGNTNFLVIFSHCYVRNVKKKNFTQHQHVVLSRVTGQDAAEKNLTAVLSQKMVKTKVIVKSASKKKKNVNYSGLLNIQ